MNFLCLKTYFYDVLRLYISKNFKKLENVIYHIEPWRPSWIVKNIQGGLLGDQAEFT